MSVDPSTEGAETHTAPEAAGIGGLRSELSSQRSCRTTTWAVSERSTSSQRSSQGENGVGLPRPAAANVPKQSDAKGGHKLFVGMVPFSSAESDIEALFAPFGAIKEVFLMRDKDGNSKGCAFVRFNTKSAADKACAKLHGTKAIPGCSHALNVKYANHEPRSSRLGSPGGGAGGFFPLAMSGSRPAMPVDLRWLGMPDQHASYGMGMYRQMMAPMPMVPHGMPVMPHMPYDPNVILMPNGMPAYVPDPYWNHGPPPQGGYMESVYVYGSGD